MGLSKIGLLDIYIIGMTIFIFSLLFFSTTVTPTYRRMCKFTALTCFPILKSSWLHTQIYCYNSYWKEHVWLTYKNYTVTNIYISSINHAMNLTRTWTNTNTRISNKHTYLIVLLHINLYKCIPICVPVYLLTNTSITYLPTLLPTHPPTYLSTQPYAPARPSALPTARIHTYIHTYIHACIHTYIQTYIHTYTRSSKIVTKQLYNITEALQWN